MPKKQRPRIMMGLVPPPPPLPPRRPQNAQPQDQVDAVRRALTQSDAGSPILQPVDPAGGYCIRCGRALGRVKVGGFNPRDGSPLTGPACVNAACCLGGGHAPAPPRNVLQMIQWLFGASTCVRCSEVFHRKSSHQSIVLQSSGQLQYLPRPRDAE